MRSPITMTSALKNGQQASTFTSVFSSSMLITAVLRCMGQISFFTAFLISVSNAGFGRFNFIL